MLQHADVWGSLVRVMFMNSTTRNAGHVCTAATTACTKPYSAVWDFCRCRTLKLDLALFDAVMQHVYVYKVQPSFGHAEFPMKVNFWAISEVLVAAVRMYT